ncbi:MULTISPECIES: glutamate 5-kinase [Priestia]|jgi:glutamate 5-kinase|uniref:Glutamate 5-kinase n=1 Tax=Priestia megaterium TaxID=1404 RepID=A0ABD4WQI8_PRIMG|nr:MULTISPECIES: glutamate 5-kinase [Priestia]KQU18065.1 gamma-glutamyl kinase [Bacillus sp. Leaf75]KRF47394.1 gamma-glutamyl kinase [Bacillus sp. Soil531]MEB2276495.1 glutamate 5-kinase [Bacillus sp. ILBB4]MCI4620434.1 glutamate 5-kinase [Priestia megaterium]MDD9782499.1 glutamate 5-kinase [Priestia megaterium]
MKRVNHRQELQNSKRIVVKVGTSTLTYDNGDINLARIEKLARVLSDLMNAGKEVVLVTSGAVQVGVKKLKLKEKPTSIRDKQAAASVGQCELMHIYSKFFGEYSHIVGQVLLTKDVIEDEHVRNNVVNTFEKLIEDKVIPIVNENDTVAIDEIENIVRFGDNDNLSAIVSVLIHADLLVILSDIDGFFDSDPTKNPNSKLMKVIDGITPELENFAGDSGTDVGTGGMVTKLTAAKTATSAGVSLILANGKEPSILRDIIEGQEIGTLFLKQAEGVMK